MFFRHLGLVPGGSRCSEITEMCDPGLFIFGAPNGEIQDGVGTVQNIRDCITNNWFRSFFMF